MAQTRDFVLGMFVGAAVGAAVAILYAPQSGPETRDYLKLKAGEAKDKAADVVDTARQKTAAVVDTAKTKARDVKDTLSTSAQQLVDTTRSTVQQQVSAVQDREGAIGFDGDLDHRLRAVELVGPRKNLAGTIIANDNAIALAA